MRMKREIEALEAKRQGPMEYPRETGPFTRFRADLREALFANDVPGDWEWAEAEQEWYATWECALYLGDDMPFALTATKHVNLDPRRPVAEEIERLIGLYKQFATDRRTFAQAGKAALGKVVA